MAAWSSICAAFLLMPHVHGVSSGVGQVCTLNDSNFGEEMKENANFPCEEDFFDL